MNIRKSKVFAVAAAACVLGMMLGGCGSSTSGNARRIECHYGI